MNINKHQDLEEKQTGMGQNIGVETSSKKLRLGYFDLIIIVFLIAVLVVAAYDRFFASKVLMVDLGAYITEQKELFAQGKIGEAEVTARLSNLQNYLKNQPENLTILTKDVVLANGKELPLPIATTGKASDSGKK